MTRQFFTTGEASHVAGNNDIYYGLTTGSQTVNIPAGVTGVVVNADVEQVNFAGNISDYKFLQQGNSVLVKNVAGATVATFRVQSDTDGTQLKFGDSGVFNAILANGAVKVGGAAISNNDNGDVAAAAASAVPNPGTVTTPAYVITSSATSVDEGTTVTFTVTAAAAASVDTIFAYQITGAATGVATVAQVNDFASTHGKVTILAGQKTGTFDVTPVTDTVNEVFEGFNVTLLDSAFNPLATSKAIVISDASYTPPTTQLTVSATDVVTNNSKSPVTFIGQVGQTTTLQASDKVSGNGTSIDAGNDTLRIVTDNVGTTTTGFTVTGVETLEVQAQATGVTTLGLENVNGLTNVRTASSTNDLVLNNVNNVVDLSFQNTINAANVTVNYTDAAVVATNNEQKIALDNNKLGTITLSNTTTAATTRTGIETVSIDTTGTGGASTLAGLTTAATVLHVVGNQDLTISGLVPNLADVEAPAFTGKLNIKAGTAATNITVVGGTKDDTIDVSTATGATTTQKVTTGTGNNTVILGSTFSQVDSITGNTGVDTVSVTDIASIKNAAVAATGETFKNSSALDTVSFAAAQGTDTFNADAYAATNTTGAGANAAGVNTYNFTKGLTGAVTINKVVDNVTVGVEQNNAIGQTLTLTKPAAITAGTSNVNFTNVNAKTANEALAVLTVAADATLKINATDADTTVLTGGGVNSVTITTLTADAALTTLLVSGNEDVVLGNNLSTAATKLATITSTTTGAFTVNASPAAAVSPAVAQALTVTAAGTNNTITTGAGADVIVANGTKAILIDAGNGNNTVTAAGAATFTTTITTGTGNDVITVAGNGTNTITTGNGDDIVTVTGTGNSSVTVGTGINKITFTAGTNTVNIKAGDFTSADTINGGTGIDTVKIIDGAVNLTDGSFYNLESVEQLSLANATNNVTVNQIANVEGLQTIVLNGGNNNIYVGEGFINPITVNVATNGVENITATVSGVTSAGPITVKAAVASISAADIISGGSSAGDSLVLTADNINLGANLSGVTNVETITIKSSVDATGAKTTNSAFVTLGNDAVVAATKTLTIDASDLTVAGSTFVFQGGAELASSLVVTGSAGADTLLGGAGDDTINGGVGADVIYGGLGVDNLTGGTGADSFTYAALANSSGTKVDSITDFVAGTHTVGGANTGDYIVVDSTLLGGKALNFAGNQSSFASAQGSTIANNGVVDYVYQSDSNTLWVDLNDDGTLNANDLQIRLPGVSAIGAGDVVAATVATTVAPSFTAAPLAPTPVVTLTAGTASVSEGASITYTATLNTAAATTLTIPYSLSGTGISPADFTGLASLTPAGSITINAGLLTNSVTLPVASDSFTDGPETVTATFTAPAGATLGNSTVATNIVDTSVALGNNPFTITTSGTYQALPATTDTITITNGVTGVIINGFANGDKLQFFANASFAILPDTNDIDGSQFVAATDLSSGAVTTIQLTGLTAQQDANVFNLPSFYATFGANSIA
jgi:hypothetical protein